MRLASRLVANLGQTHKLAYIGPYVAGIATHPCICGEMNQTGQTSAGLKLLLAKSPQQHLLAERDPFFPAEKESCT